MYLFWFAHVTNQGLGNRMGCVLTCLLTMESWQPPAVPKWTDLDWVWRLLDLFGKPWNSLRNGKVPQKYVCWVCLQSLSCTTKPTPGHPFWNQLMAAPKIETNISHIKQRLDPQSNPIGIWWFQPQRMARRRGIHKKNMIDMCQVSCKCSCKPSCLRTWSRREKPWQTMVRFDRLVLFCLKIGCTKSQWMIVFFHIKWLVGGKSPIHSHCISI